VGTPGLHMIFLYLFVNQKVLILNCSFWLKGRILHLISENLMSISNIRLFILDEADKLLASEFQDSIKYDRNYTNKINQLKFEWIIKNPNFKFDLLKATR
jgi:hypothetical protein